MSHAIHWFRRDLRLSDNTALNAALAAHEQVIPVYITSLWKNGHQWTGAPRQQFLVECLRSLHEALLKAGSRLLIREGDAVSALVKLVQQTGAKAVYTNRDPDPSGQAIEAQLKAALEPLGVSFFCFKDHALHERDEVLTGSGSAFRVFTPYSRAWAKLPKPQPGPTVTQLRASGPLESLPLPTLAHWNLQAENVELPEAGEAAARNRLSKFVENGFLKYAQTRDIPSEEGTSRISQDLRFGLLSIREVFAALEVGASGAKADEARSAQVYINELCWREFYFQVLWNKPEVLDLEYSPAYRGMPWSHDTAAFDLWCTGQTGFPIVDAGMRQLFQTGFMHNRVRMIVAMFLTKDLHLDWRMGERWFMQRLLDGEIASNNGGWQWSAGTGTDAAPYFRIQNPWTQSLRFDAAGTYIKRWIPELAHLPSALLHKPPTPGLRLTDNYPLPMVDHARERDIALFTYKRHLSSSQTAE